MSILLYALRASVRLGQKPSIWHMRQEIQPANDISSIYTMKFVLRFGSSVLQCRVVHDLMRILLAEIQHNVDITRNGEFTFYDNRFNASYGWESVMMEWFDVMTPFLADGSELLIYPDEDYDKLVVKNGKCVQIH